MLESLDLFHKWKQFLMGYTQLETCETIVGAATLVKLEEISGLLIEIRDELRKRK